MWSNIFFLSSFIIFPSVGLDIYRYIKKLNSPSEIYISRENKLRSELLNYKNLEWSKKHFQELSNIDFEYYDYIGWRRNTYIGQTICIRTRIQQHNSGYGSTSTQPTYLRPFAILAYICGFGGRKTLREHVEYQWKLKRDQLIRNGINEIKQWAECGRDVINEITLHDDSIVQSDLTLVLLF